MSKQDQLRETGDHLLDQVRTLLDDVEPVLVQSHPGQGDPGEMSKHESPGLDRVTKTQRFLLVVDPEVGQTLHQLRYLCIV